MYLIPQIDCIDQFGVFQQSDEAERGAVEPHSAIVSSRRAKAIGQEVPWLDAMCVNVCIYGCVCVVLCVDG